MTEYNKVLQRYETRIGLLRHVKSKGDNVKSSFRLFKQRYWEDLIKFPLISTKDDTYHAYPFRFVKDDIHKEYIDYQYMIVFDVDKGDVKGSLEKLCKVFDLFYYFYHSTPSHTKESPRYRFYLPLKEPIPGVVVRDHFKSIANWKTSLALLNDITIDEGENRRPGGVLIPTTKSLDNYEWYISDGDVLYDVYPELSYIPQDDKSKTFKHKSDSLFEYTGTSELMIWEWMESNKDVNLFFTEFDEDGKYFNKPSGSGLGRKNLIHKVLCSLISKNLSNDILEEVWTVLDQNGYCTRKEFDKKFEAAKSFILGAKQ